MKRFLFFLLLFLIGCVVYFSAGSAVTKNQHNYIYELPFREGTSHQVVQGYGGRFSHTNKAALDFSMPEGTPVYAAREGVLFSSKDNSDAGGLLAKNENANYIIIQHSDGSFGCYWHLKKNGVAVKKGKVAKGQLIGYSGNTGFSLRPHLHFAVKSKLSYHKDSFVKTMFRSTEGDIFLDGGKRYERPGRN